MVYVSCYGGVVEAGEQVYAFGVPGLGVESLWIGVDAAGEAADQHVHLIDACLLLSCQHVVDGSQVLASEVGVAVDDAELSELIDIHVVRSSGCVRPRIGPLGISAGR